MLSSAPGGCFSPAVSSVAEECPGKVRTLECKHLGLPLRTGKAKALHSKVEPMQAGVPQTGSKRDYGIKVIEYSKSGTTEELKI